MFGIELEFLTGRYIATSYNSRQRAEWPPHPARLFSALVATHFAADKPDPAERAALEWLEVQGPPLIRASEASEREVVTVFVPVNDAGITDVDAEAEAVERASAVMQAETERGDAGGLRAAEKQLGKAQERLADAIRKSTAVPTKVPKSLPRVLPDDRVRQPRTFPSVTPEDPRVTFAWPDAVPVADHARALEALARRLVRVGHSSSLVAAKIVADVPTSQWRPADIGEEIFRTVSGGQLAALERAFELHRETEPRIMPANFQYYTRRTAPELARLCRSSFSDEWLVLRRVGGPALPLTSGVGVARAIRRVLLSFSAQPVPAVLSGHTPDGGPSADDHVAIVPLPFVGHEHSGGTIMGVAIVLPRGLGDAARRAVYGAVAAWENQVRASDEDTPTLPLHLGAAGVLELERVEWGHTPVSLRPQTWCRPARIWRSVTPVALDRNPGDLRAKDPGRQRSAIDSAIETIGRACARIGLPVPQIELLPAAPVVGAPPARRYPAFASGDLTRVLTHVRMEFDEEVAGPVLLGAGRYFGLGLFRPGDADD